jgi:hypothetical protein
VIELAEPVPEATVEDILVKLVAAFMSSFPGRADSFPLKLTPEDRLPVIKKKAGERVSVFVFVCLCVWKLICLFISFS